MLFVLIKICIRVFMPDLVLTQNRIIYYLAKKDFEIPKGKLERVIRRKEVTEKATQIP